MLLQFFLGVCVMMRRLAMICQCDRSFCPIGPRRHCENSSVRCVCSFPNTRSTSLLVNANPLIADQLVAWRPKDCDDALDQRARDLLG